MILLASSLAWAWPAPTRADCAGDCSSSCETDDAKEWARCTERCIKQCLKDDPPPVPDVPKPTPVEGDKKKD
jgi:hypothetical protein